MDCATLKDPQVIEHMQRLNAIWSSFDAKVEKMQADLDKLQDVFPDAPHYAAGLSKKVMK